MHSKLTMILVLASFVAIAQQVTDEFNDDLESDPTWLGDTASFIVKGGSLWSDHQVAYDAWSIYTHLPLIQQFDLSWASFLHINTSSLNYCEMALYSNVDRKDGIRFRIGGTSDNIVVYAVIDGAESVLFSGMNKVTENARLQIDIRYEDNLLTGKFSGSGYTEKFYLPDSLFVKDLQPVVLEYGIKQSTSGFFGKHELEYVKYGVPVKDTSAPAVKRLSTLHDSAFSVLFTEPLSTAMVPEITVEHPNGLRYIIDPVFDTPDSMIVHLRLANNAGHRIFLRGLCDETGNCTDTTFDFIPVYHQKPVFGDIIITEIMADPEPAVYLPEAEYIELHNRSDKIVDLTRIILTDGDARIDLPAFFLYPDSFMAISGEQITDRPFREKFLHADKLFSLNNQKQYIRLETSDGDLLHEVEFVKEWITDRAKAAGGWSVEMGDISRYCTFNGNWQASRSYCGGTPGKPNAVAITIDDLDPPAFRSVGLEHDSELILRFNETILPVSFRDLTIHTDFPVEHVGYSLNTIRLKTGVRDLEGIHTFTIGGYSDCYLNRQADADTIAAARPGTMHSGDVIINELLFNASEAAEYVELVNVSDSTMDLSDVIIRLRSSGTWSAGSRLVPYSQLLTPGEIICFTSDPERVVAHFGISADPGRILYADLPALNNSGSQVGIAHRSLWWLDTVRYHEDMHHAALQGYDDVSLERLHPDVTAPTFVSATSESGYGTPGKWNSVDPGARRPLPVTTTIRISPDPFTPDNDGLHDQLEIGFAFPGAFTYSVSVFDLGGTLVSRLAEMAYGVDQFSIMWDGTADGKILARGIYFILVDYHAGDQLPARALKCVTLDY